MSGGNNKNKGGVTPLSTAQIDRDTLMPPLRSYTKSEICILLVDPRFNLSHPVIPFKPLRTEQLKRDVIKLGIHKLFGWSEHEYSKAVRLPVSMCEMIFRELL